MVELFGKVLKENGVEMFEYFVKILFIIIYVILLFMIKSEWEKFKGIVGDKDEKKIVFFGLFVLDNK